MKKNLLIVVDEKQMGGVSILLEDMLNLNVFDAYNTDILVLHNNGSRLVNIPKNINIIYGSKYFNTVDLPLNEVIKSKKINLLFSKIRLVFEMKTGLIKQRIKKERKKILNKKYDLEIAFKDGFTALFTIFGNSDKKIHWLHYEYKNINPNKRYDKIFQKIIPEFDKIIAVSEGVKKAFMEIYNVKDIKVIPNLINSKKIINMSKEKPIIPIYNDKINVVLVGRIHEVKGYDRFLRVIERLYKNGLGHKLSINLIGDGPLLNNIKCLNDEKNLNIKFWGMIDNPYKEIKNFDLFVLPSYYEAFGLVVLESFVLKVPVLATETAATTSLIKNKENGLVVKNTEEGLYEGFKYLMENKELLKLFKQNLNNFNYDITEKINQIKEVLEEW